MVGQLSTSNNSGRTAISSVGGIFHRGNSEDKMEDGSEYGDELRERLLEVAQFATRPSAPPPSPLTPAERTWSCDWKPRSVDRPYLVDQRPRTARARRSDPPWGEAGRLPDTSKLSSRLCEELADEWLQDALFEHASIASFSRFSMELLAVGAPAELVRAAYDAAADEVLHSQLCFGLASAYRGEPLGPTAFPFEPAVPIEADLISMAVTTFEAGCIGETLAALQAAEQLSRASDPAVCSVLERLAKDEARHAELAFETVAWAIRKGGHKVEQAISAVMGRASWVPDASDTVPALARQLMMAHGRLDPHSIHRLQIHGLQQVVMPCARAMLGSSIASVAVDDGQQTGVWRTRRRS